MHWYGHNDCIGLSRVSGGTLSSMAVSEDIYLVECATQIVYAVLFYIHEVISEKYI